MPTNQQEFEAYVQITEQRMNEMRAQAHQQQQQLQHTEQRLQQAQQQLQQNQHEQQQHVQPVHVAQPVIRMRDKTYSRTAASMLFQ
jgi:chromosome segregation ATPase